MTIELRCDAKTGRRDIVVKLYDDAELLPHEHEQLHRKLVDKLIEGGLLRAGEGGRLIVEREESHESAQSPQQVEEHRRPVGEGH